MRREEMRAPGKNACFVFDGRGEMQNVFFRVGTWQRWFAVTALMRMKPSLRKVSSRSRNGCRAGVCGRVTTDNDGAGGFRRRLPCVFAREKRSGGERRGFSFFVEESGRVCVLLLGPPGCGKTTVLRDAQSGLRGEGSAYRLATNEKNYSRRAKRRQGLT